MSRELVLGVDPGLATSGYACLAYSGKGQEVEMIEKGVLRTDAALPLERRLARLFADMDALLKHLRPQVMAMEEFYSVPGHPRTAILMAHARGVICLSAALNEVEVVNYAVRAVKQAITGSGRASKEQVQRMVAALARLREPPTPRDVADALALALCHCLGRGKKPSPLPSGSMGDRQRFDDR